MPCNGIYVDVNKLPSENMMIKNTAMFIERYKNYKKFYETCIDGDNCKASYY